MEKKDNLLGKYVYKVLGFAVLGSLATGFTGLIAAWNTQSGTCLIGSAIAFGTLLYYFKD